MKTKIKTTFKVSETNITYTAETKENQVLLWVVNSDGSILIKKPEAKANDAAICELTLDANNLHRAILNLEKETGILCEKTSARKVYTHKFSSKTDDFDVYFLPVNLDPEHKEIVEDRFKGQFIDYREVMTHLDEKCLSSDCKEALLSLIAHLYEKYSYL